MPDADPPLTGLRVDPAAQLAQAAGDTYAAIVDWQRRLDALRRTIVCHPADYHYLAALLNEHDPDHCITLHTSTHCPPGFMYTMTNTGITPPPDAHYIDKAPDATHT
jgi:hypothetical protein